MLVDTGLTFREIVMNDPLPKGTIQQAVINFLEGPVQERLEALEAGPEVLAIWRQLVAEEILPEEEDDEFL